jgi:hypothetical protein
MNWVNIESMSKRVFPIVYANEQEYTGTCLMLLDGIVEVKRV